MAQKKTFFVALGLICVTFVMIVFSRDQRGDGTLSPKARTYSGYNGEDLFYRHELGDDFVCGDGTPFVFYTRRPLLTSPNFNNWIIRLEGGGRYCEDQSTCDHECASFDCYYLSTMSDPCLYRDPEGGMFCTSPSEYNERFHDWSMVWLHACNGDDWLGQAHVGHPANPTSYHFTGALNMWGVFKYLAADPDWQPETLIVAGVDTAGHALQHQINRLYDFLIARLPEVNLKFSIDGAWNHEEYMCYDVESCTPYLGNVELRYTNQVPQLSDECVEANPEFPHRCYYAAEYSAKHVKHHDKTIYMNSHFDSRMLVYAGVPAVDRSEAADSWKLARATYLSSEMDNAGIVNLWESACQKHTFGNKADWYSVTTLGITPMEAVFQFIHSDPGTSYYRDRIYIPDPDDSDFVCQAEAIDLNFPGNRDPYPADMCSWYD